MTPAGDRPILSTYRLQLRADFDFRAAAELVDYLASLGVSHLYASPLLESAAGSVHGYDVVDPTEVSAERGGRAGLDALVDTAHAAGLGLVMDIVPNHMGVEVPRQNAPWWDVLTHGRDSKYAGWFDVDWTQPRIALPILGDDPAETDRLSIVDGQLAYHHHRFPIAPGTAGGNARQIHDRQHYELVSWRSGRVGYRRFFMVNTLAALRQEDPAVFAETHRLVGELVAAGAVDGIRVDHPDGLTDPAEYLRHLAELAPNTWLVVEKILAPDERLDDTLPVAGTTGYDALRLLDGVFINPADESASTELAAEITGDPGDAETLTAAEHDLQYAVATTGLRPELRRITRLLSQSDQNTPSSPEQSSPELWPYDEDTTIRALAALAAELPVYRADYQTTRALLPAAVADAVRRRGDLEPALSRVAATLANPVLPHHVEAAARFHQTCGAITAKAIEDRLFYQSNRLASLNEVGGDPRRFGVSVGEFHLATADRADRWPAAMTTLSTHDTKRAADVRARIAVLAELSDEWATAVRRWTSIDPPPEPRTGYLLWQTLVGLWPVDGSEPPAERLHAYAEKAIREAGLATDWNDVDSDHEIQLHHWLDRVLTEELAPSIAAFAESCAPHGWSNSLGAHLLQLAGPGIPDVYQGCELWDDSLVDPDNRREVDFAMRRAMLADLDTTNRPPAVDATGAAKMWVISRALRARRAAPSVFVGGGYVPFSANGRAADHLIGFTRTTATGAPAAIAVATRLAATLSRSGGWGDTSITLPPGTWTNHLTGQTHTDAVPLTTLLTHLPVALLTQD